VSEEGGEGGTVLRPAERERVRHRCPRPCSEREQEHVVPELLAILGCEHVSLGIDGGHDSLVQLGARGFRQRLQREPFHLTDAKRLYDRERAVDELALGRNKVERHPVLGERAQGERRLERGDAAARDDHSQGVSSPRGRRLTHRFSAATLSRAHRKGIGLAPDCGCG
jgi:hypothetical protein